MCVCVVSLMEQFGKWKSMHSVIRIRISTKKYKFSVYFLAGKENDHNLKNIYRFILKLNHILPNYA